MTRLPDFLIVGAMKTGTSSLWRYLIAHRGIYRTPIKEPMFFSEYWDQGIDWYASLFEDAARDELVGEASTHYSIREVFPRVPERIASIMPAVRIIYVVREPIERLRSLYEHRIHMQVEDRPLSKVLLSEPDYLDSGRYSSQIEAFREYFDREQVLVLSCEQLSANPHAEVARVLRFLELDVELIDLPLQERFNTRDEKHGYSRAFRAFRHVGKRLSLSRAVPVSIKRGLRGFSARPIDRSESPITPEVRSIIHEALTRDMRRLSQYATPEQVPWLANFLEDASPSGGARA